MMKLFEEKKTSSLAAPSTKPTNATTIARISDIKSKITPNCKKEPRKLPEVKNLQKNTNLKTKKIENLKPTMSNTAHLPAHPIKFQGKFNPPTKPPNRTFSTSATDQSQNRNKFFKIQNSGGKYPPNQSESDKISSWAKTDSDWTAPGSNPKTQN
jgi:hypothetical protein